MAVLSGATAVLSENLLNNDFRCQAGFPLLAGHFCQTRNVRRIQFQALNSIPPMLSLLAPVTEARQLGSSAM